MLEARRLERLGDLHIAVRQANQNKVAQILALRERFDAVQLVRDTDYRQFVRNLLAGVKRRNDWKPEEEVTDIEISAEQLLAGIQHYEEIMEEIRKANEGNQ